MKRNTAQRDRDRAAIRRTGAGCALCGQPIDYDLPHLDPMAYVVDHVVPLQMGGPDELANKQAAHRRPEAATEPKVRGLTVAPCSSAAGHSHGRINQAKMTPRGCNLRGRGRTT